MNPETTHEAAKTLAAGAATFIVARFAGRCYRRAINKVDPNKKLPAPVEATLTNVALATVLFEI